MTRQPSPHKAPKSCWTCKQRKIACDKASPVCQNCIRSKRSCGGYGIKLLWPESGDGRRPVFAWQCEQPPSTPFLPARQFSDFCFLNTTPDDLLPFNACETPIPHQGVLALRCKVPIAPRSLAFGYEASLEGNDGWFLSYYHHVLSRMITTIDDDLNGFRTILLPRALSSQSLSSQSLRQTILALAAFHSSGQKQAIPYKVSAMQLLQRSIGSKDECRSSQVATCMMLCVIDVFDSADRSWYTHLAAAKNLHNNALTQQPSGFLDSWLMYHDILAGFSRPDRKSAERRDISLPGQEDDQKVIIGALGCSLHLFRCISCINDLAVLIKEGETDDLPHEYASYPKILLDMIVSPHQRHPVAEASDVEVADSQRIMRTAELYRTATEIYLRRSVMLTTSRSLEVQKLVNAALGMIESLGVCTSPWPFFVAACEVIDDDQRFRVLRALHKMRVERRIGNIEIMREIIEGLWKKRDLGFSNLDWRQIAESQGHMPSFI